MTSTSTEGTNGTTGTAGEAGSNAVSLDEAEGDYGYEDS